MNNDQIIKYIKDIGVMLKGHFKLSSGLHSDNYVQCSKIFTNYQYSTKICNLVYDKIKLERADVINKADLVISAAMGGLFFGYEIARKLKINNIFCERVNGKFQFRRSFEIKNNSKIIIAEDVFTTGKSTKEIIDLIASYKKKNNINCEIILLLSIVNRSSNKIDLNNVFGGIDYLSLVNIDSNIFDIDNIPQELQNIKAIKPGSRLIK